MRELRIFLLVLYVQSSLCGKILEEIEAILLKVNEVDLQTVKPSLYLFTNNSSEAAFNYTWDVLQTRTDDLQVQEIWNGTEKLAFIMHGFRENSQEEWIKRMKDSYIKRGYTVILVDWRGATQFSLGFAEHYARAVNVVPQMAELLASFLLRILTTYGIDANDVIFVGFSLGAQTGGSFTKLMNEKHGIKLGRFVSLDAAAPLFWDRGISPSKEDVVFLEAVHTSSSDNQTLTEELGGKFGLEVNYGHVDFYPNGGKKQPGCQASILSPCAHRRAHDLYLEALENTEAARSGMGIIKQCGNYQEAVKETCNLEPTHSFYMTMPPAYCNDSCIISYKTAA